MKNFNVLFIVGILLFTAGCRDITGSTINKVIEKVSISSSAVFKYQTGISGDEEMAAIIQQPEHYEISTIVRDSTTNWKAVYKYKPESGFKGTDYVQIKLGTGLDGASPNTNFEIIKIEITVN